MITLLIIIITAWIVARWLDARDWNNGISRKSGKPWVAFDTDSSGATGYSDGEGNTLWK